MRIARASLRATLIITLISQLYTAPVLASRGGYNSPSSRVIYSFVQSSRALLLNLWGLRRTFYQEQQDYHQSTVSHLYLPTQLALDLYQGKWSWGGYASALANLPLQLAEQQVFSSHTKTLIKIGRLGLFSYMVYSDPTGSVLRISLPATAFLAMQALQKAGYPVAKALKSWVYLGSDLAVSPLAHLIKQVSSISNRLEALKKTLRLDEQLLFGGRALPSGQPLENDFITLKQQRFLKAKVLAGKLLSQSRWETLNTVTPHILSAFLASRHHPSLSMASIAMSLPLTAGKAIYNAPYVKNPIPDQYALTQQTFNWRLPYNTFGDVSDGMFTTLTGVNGTALPSWLKTTFAPLRQLEDAFISTWMDSLAVDSQNQRAYLTARSIGMVVINISNPLAPTEMGRFGSLNANKVAVSGNTAYLLGTNDNNLYAVNVTNPSRITLLDSISLPNSHNDFTIDGDVIYASDSSLTAINISDPHNLRSISSVNLGQSGHQIFIANQSAYLWGSGSNDAFLVFDIIDPNAITEVGQGVVGEAIEALTVVDLIAYVISQPSHRNNGSLSLFDVGLPGNISLLSSTPTLGKPYQVAVNNDVAYVADWSYLSAFNISNPFQVRLLSNSSQVHLAHLIATAGQHAYLNGLFIFDISNPSNLTTPSGLTFNLGMNDVSINNDLAYTASGQSGLVWFNISDPGNVQVRDSIGLRSQPSDNLQAVTLNGQIAYIAHSNKGITALNVSQPTLMAVLSQLNTPENARKIHITNGIAYVPSSSTGKSVALNISNPRNINLLGTLSNPGTAQEIITNGTFAYVADGNTGLTVLNITDPSNTGWLGSVALPSGSAKGLRIQYPYAYIAAGTGGLMVFDISNNSNISLLSSLATPGNAVRLALAGDTAYIVNDDNLMAVNISDPYNLNALGSLNAYYPSNMRSIVLAGDVAYTTNYDALMSFDITRNLTGTPLSSGVFPLSVNLVDNSGNVFSRATFNLIVASTPSTTPSRWPTSWSFNPSTSTSVSPTPYPNRYPTVMPSVLTNTLAPTITNLSTTFAPHSGGNGRPRPFPYNLNPWVVIGIGATAGCSAMTCIWCTYHRCQKQRQLQEQRHSEIMGLPRVQQRPLSSQPSIEIIERNSGRSTPQMISPVLRHTTDPRPKSDDIESSNSSSELFDDNEKMYDDDPNTTGGQQTTSGNNTNQSQGKTLKDDQENDNNNNDNDNSNNSNNSNSTNDRITPQQPDNPDDEGMNPTVEGGDVPA